ncbi:hypothetical protein DY000_02044530 [Brassica cretica]|uniref:Uncharacterized protein n=1 Tax=Brassica cretica TaxID=69181 RepID=A0ABQ7ESF8_BRACR|nr:hypothetical protein DY000_02044530 [Brassica cretica]
MMETFPKTTVDVFALVLESGGKYDNLGRLLTALLVLWVSVTMEINLNCNLALADAGIMMCDHITAVSVSLRNLKLKLPDEYTISSFQLVPETTAGAASRPDTDSDKDTL